MDIETGGFILKCEGSESDLRITGYEGDGAILDISSDNRITGIDKKVFFSCRSLKKVFLPASIVSIGDWCFSNCINLTDFSIDTEPDGRLFGRGVFDACERLRTVTFSGTDMSTSVLLAAGVGRMKSEHLLRAEDIGQKFWYDKWDISLMSLLKADDAENSISTAVSGEEDISYDGVAMVDGEMSGPTENHVKTIAKNKSYLCFLRLLHDEYLSTEIRDKIEEYIRSRSFGCDREYAWTALKEDCEGDVDYYEIYLSVVRPDRDTILKMIDDLGPSRVQARALLISKAKGEDNASSALDELML